MEMYTNSIQCIAGDTLTFQIIVRYGTTPVDLTGTQFIGYVKSENVPVMPFEFDVTDIAIGIVRPTLSATSTSAIPVRDKPYTWYVRMVQENYIKTIGRGAIKVIAL